MLVKSEKWTRFRLTVSGRVQGVGFRYFARQNAVEKALTGWALNRPNGVVEMEVQGSAEAVADFLKVMRRGPDSADVAQVKTEALEVKLGETSFEIF